MELQSERNNLMFRTDQGKYLHALK